ncbi:PREDICTED: phospholipase A1-like [Vollenhovia emeryi]|uniref:phospholipase A1-like n=1 Tax=Vollenhovia emeryi TaxID=411798 RepID=UPI0005F4A6F3|nr:PREDICTED: phospholipase A1-like [Vollenhovia emeryi]
MMRMFVTILAILLVRHAHSLDAPKSLPKPMSKSLPEPLFFSDDHCAFGVKTVSLFLYNSNIKGQKINVNDICKYVHPSQKVVFIVHGAIGSVQKDNFPVVATALTQKGYIVFSVDWSQGACTNMPNSDGVKEKTLAVRNAVAAGQRVARFVTKLVTECKFPLANVIFLGHSLGSHVAGFAAKVIQQLELGTIPLIIVGDPIDFVQGDPLTTPFSSRKCNDRLCYTDTSCLKVLHSSSDGIGTRMGHLDLQFNDGQTQPSCWWDATPACSHLIVIEYILKVFENKCSFPGVHFNGPSCSSPNETNFILVNDNLLDISCSIQGEYYVFVDCYPYCSEYAPQTCRQ